MPNTDIEAVRTSDFLTVGEVYTRAQLKDRFEIVDATINTGVFRPKGHDSIWLFVTQSKTPDRTQYEDLLEQDVLHWQGQSSGRTDDLIREHRQRGLELLLFYRHAKYEFPGAGFRYEGQFDYVSDEGERPASFILHRRVETDELTIAQAQAQARGAFEPDSIEDARARTMASIVLRQGQQAFRQALLAAYEGRCAITGCDVAAVLEAAHIYPYQGATTNTVANGLLLRADLHTLFDLGWITVDAHTLTVAMHPSLRDSDYGHWHGQPLRLPTDGTQHPSQGALAWHQTHIGR